MRGGVVDFHLGAQLIGVQLQMIDPIRSHIGRQGIAALVGPDPRCVLDADASGVRYLHQGSGFTQRFDANSYLTITRAMDFFDLVTDQGGDLAAVAALQIHHPDLASLIISSVEDELATVRAPGRWQARIGQLQGGEVKRVVRRHPGGEQRAEQADEGDRCRHDGGGLQRVTHGEVYAE